MIMVAPTVPHPHRGCELMVFEVCRRHISAVCDADGGRGAVNRAFPETAPMSCQIAARERAADPRKAKAMAAPQSWFSPVSPKASIRQNSIGKRKVVPSCPACSANTIPVAQFARYGIPT